MIDNYESLPTGAIKQINIDPFKYDYDYVDKSYNKIDNNSMSCLRLGNIIGTLGYTPQSILDVGYGNGNFLEWCSKLIPGCFGNDIEPAYPLPEKIAFTKDITDKFYEVITFFDCLEHFNNLDFIGNLKCRWLVVSLPWCHYFSDEWFKNWKHRKPNEHIWFFNDDSLRNTMQQYNFTLIRTNNIEDTIRKHEHYPNILTQIYLKNEA